MIHVEKESASFTSNQKHDSLVITSNQKHVNRFLHIKLHTKN